MFSDFDEAMDSDGGKGCGEWLNQILAAWAMTMRHGNVEMIAGFPLSPANIASIAI